MLACFYFFSSIASAQTANPNNCPNTYTGTATAYENYSASDYSNTVICNSIQLKNLVDSTILNLNIPTDSQGNEVSLYDPETDTLTFTQQSGLLVTAKASFAINAALQAAGIGLEFRGFKYEWEIFKPTASSELKITVRIKSNSTDGMVGNGLIYQATHNYTGDAFTSWTLKDDTGFGKPPFAFVIQDEWTVEGEVQNDDPQNAIRNMKYTFSYAPKIGHENDFDPNHVYPGQQQNTTQEGTKKTDFDAISKFDYFNKLKNSANKISSFITIQEGCDKFCHFCVVPFTRGPECSRKFEHIIDEAKSLAESGAKEIILLGQNVNAYNSENYRLSNLILEIEKIKEIERIRYTTSHPKDMTEDLIEVYKYSKKLMPLVHLPVQTGSDRVLNLMNRKHTIKDYINIYNKLTKINSSIKFSSDFIIAYPGETEEDFNLTYNLIKEIKFINSYSFIFSPRPGTVASNLDLIDRKISHKRLEKIQELLSNNQLQINKSIENKIIEVLVENQTEDKKKLFGKSEYMTSVIFNGDKKNIGKVVKVKIIRSNRNTLIGEMFENFNQKVA